MGKQRSTSNLFASGLCKRTQTKHKHRLERRNFVILMNGRPAGPFLLCARRVLRLVTSALALPLAASDDHHDRLRPLSVFDSTFHLIELVLDFVLSSGQSEPSRAKQVASE